MLKLRKSRLLISMIFCLLKIGFFRGTFKWPYPWKLLTYIKDTGTSEKACKSATNAISFKVKLYVLFLKNSYHFLRRRNNQSQSTLLAPKSRNITSKLVKEWWRYDYAGILVQMEWSWRAFLDIICYGGITCV